jgi:hypothetical protein
MNELAQKPSPFALPNHLILKGSKPAPRVPQKQMILGNGSRKNLGFDEADCLGRACRWAATIIPYLDGSPLAFGLQSPRIERHIALLCPCAIIRFPSPRSLEIREAIICGYRFSLTF